MDKKTSEIDVEVARHAEIVTSQAMRSALKREAARIDAIKDPHRRRLEEAKFKAKLGRYVWNARDGQAVNRETKAREEDRQRALSGREQP